MNTGCLKEGPSSGHLKLVAADAKKSAVWKKFLKVVDATISAPVRHVQCSDCKAFLSYDGAKMGTPHLNRHNCNSSSKCASITSFFARNKVSIPLSVKERLAMTCVSLCAKDTQPFDVVRGEGFVEVVDEVISIGAHYESIPASDVHSDPTTMSLKVADVANAMRDAARPTTEATMKQSRCAVTTDLWIDYSKKVAYTTAMIYTTNNCCVAEELFLSELGVLTLFREHPYFGRRHASGWACVKKPLFGLARTPKSALTGPAIFLSKRATFAFLGQLWFGFSLVNSNSGDTFSSVEQNRSTSGACFFPTACCAARLVLHVVETLKINKSCTEGRKIK